MVSFAGTVVVVVLDVVIDVVILLDEDVDVSINNIGYDIIAKRWKIVNRCFSSIIIRKHNS